MSAPIAEVLAYRVMSGAFIPAHDKTYDLAADIAAKLDEFHGYVAEVRDTEQADSALIELTDAIGSAVYGVTRPKRRAVSSC